MINNNNCERISEQNVRVGGGALRRTRRASQGTPACTAREKERKRESEWEKEREGKRECLQQQQQQHLVVVSQCAGASAKFIASWWTSEYLLFGGVICCATESQRWRWTGAARGAGVPPSRSADNTKYAARERSFGTHHPREVVYAASSPPLGYMLTIGFYCNLQV